jgi:hypothetical protein
VTYVLLGADGRFYESDVKGQWGGHRGQRIYGRLDCPSALRAIARGGYVRHRVFFADEATAIAAGYRPCAVCCPSELPNLEGQAPVAPPVTGDQPGRQPRNRRVATTRRS